MFPSAAAVGVFGVGSSRKAAGGAVGCHFTTAALGGAVREAGGVFLPFTVVKVRFLVVSFRTQTVKLSFYLLSPRVVIVLRTEPGLGRRTEPHCSVVSWLSVV